MALKEEFDESLEYIDGTYTQWFKPRPPLSAVADAAVEPLQKEEEEKQENKGLRELIDSKDSTEARILHRNVRQHCFSKV
ncbi:hypothetical protein E2542_SST12104 [Spatholobus suberectus]|nr:hypothetical protein E2542_SST12104 [Spatholobus suberectus]